MKQSIQKQRDFSTSSVNNNNNKPLRSSSMVSSPNGDDSFSNEPEFNKDGTKNVKYVFRYKPKESQVHKFTSFFLFLSKVILFDLRKVFN